MVSSHIPYRLLWAELADHEIWRSLFSSDYLPCTGHDWSTPGSVLFAWTKNESLSIPTSRFWPLIKLAVPNVLIWNMMIILGVRMLPSGRAAILGYTMPIWAVLASCLVYRETELSGILWNHLCCIRSAVAAVW